MPSKKLPAPANNGLSAPASEPRLEQSLLDLVHAAGQCQDLRHRLATAPPPDTETLIQLHRVLIYNLLSQPNPGPEVLKQVEAPMKTVLAWAGLQEKRKERELAEQKYRDQLAAQQALERKEKFPEEEQGLSLETLEWIEKQLNLF